MKLQNKNAVITGGSRGIGKAVAAAFLREGAKVMLIARSNDELSAAKAELFKTGDGVIEIFPADVSNFNEMNSAMKAAIEAFGAIDIVVNGAGVYGAIGTIATVNVEEWKKTFDINLFGVLNVIKAVLSIWEKTPVARGKRKIINFSGGGDGPLPHFSAYNASKVAIVRLTETLAKEFVGQDIDVNAVAPGPVNTKILEDALTAGEALVGKEMYEKLLKQKQEGGVSPEKAAELCVFLASSASDGLSGKLISAIWDKYNEWTKNDIAQLMASDKLTLRRINLL